MNIIPDPAPILARIREDLPPDVYAILMLAHVPRTMIDDEGFLVNGQRMASTIGPDYVSLILERLIQDLEEQKEQWGIKDVPPGESP